MNNKHLTYFMITIILVVLFSCQKEIFIPSGEGLDDWTVATHTSEVSPNYDVVFDETKVNKIHIVFSSDEWSDMQSDLADVTSSSGGGGGPGGGGGDFSDQTPMSFAADFYFNGIQWYNVGVRYKGNSSLTANTGKLPLRFNFDKFEDDYPEIYNQRFYGFKELAMSSSYNDLSLMREKSASDLFRDFGVPAVRTAFYEIYIDKGTGIYQYFGLYTMDEVVFDSFLVDYFGSESGNCYKPDGDGAAFSSSGFNLDDFENKTNTTSNDKSDVQAMYDALHASNRISNPTAWKAGLEAVFDVDGFLKYLAVNNTIQNWDTYGLMTHNYYLYNDPLIGKLRWVVWDNNEAFTSGTGNRQALSLGMSEVDDSWPLISYLIANADYETTYKSYVKSFVNSSFTSSRMSGIYTSQESLLLNSAENEESGYTFLTGGVSSFNSAVTTLKSHNVDRISAAVTYAP
jgi:spore coat protein CotH